MVVVTTEDSLGSPELFEIEEEFSRAFGDVELLNMDPGGSGGAGPNNEELLAIWSMTNEMYTLTYEVTVPTDVESGDTFEIDGTVITGDTSQQLPSATLTVFEEAGPPALPGQDNPPRDLDDDGRYEDVNGDSEFSIADVQVLFENRDSNAVTNNPEAFNFDGNDPPGVSLSDFQALYIAFTQSD